MTIMSELDRQEQEILATFEAGEWKSVGEPDRLMSPGLENQKPLKF